MDINDEYILKLKRVSPQIAARYLGISDDKIYDGLQDGSLPFGTAFKSKESGKWIYDIRPKALVSYNRYGRMNTHALADEITQKVISAIYSNNQEAI